MIKDAITALVEGNQLTRSDAYAALTEIMSGEATPAQIGAFITALRIRGESPEVIAGCAEAMREKFTPVEAGADIVVDTCGTGGDKSHTFNISTASAFVTAGAGVTVAKHGNRSVSSQCGSADVLAALGVRIEAPPEVMARCLRECRVAFLFAPTLHPAMKFAIGPRREIGIRSIFNILGPLSNPARAQYGVLGVYAEDLVTTMAAALAALGAKRMFVVHGLDGLDEITTTAPTLVGEVRDGQVSSYEIDAQSFGLPRATREDLAGGAPEENASIIRAILSGEKGPKRDIVLINSAAAIVAGGQARDLKEGLVRAAESIDSGAAMERLILLVQLTREDA
ncbi:MAG: anthranilate phosphoribosyltransferase [Kiritimatiellae bacterium]|nr:anthranilate phosphoribosyltransferase [Kiritimatiellia bacterium]